jgi:ComF family protein
MKPLLKDLFSHISLEIEHFFFPPTCSICNQPNTEFLCKDCLVQLQKSIYPQGSFTSRFGDLVFCSSRYTKEASLLITSLKYRRNYPAAQWIAKMMYPLFETQIPYSHIHDSVLIPVPLSLHKKYSRGYNQCELIVDILSRMTGLPKDYSSLQRRVLWTDRDQIGRTRKQREENLSCLFNWVGGKSYPTILLIDDICTTGKTLFECRRAIQQHLPHCNVHPIVFAHPEA